MTAEVPFHGRCLKRLTPMQVARQAQAQRLCNSNAIRQLAKEAPLPFRKTESYWLFHTEIELAERQRARGEI